MLDFKLIAIRMRNATETVVGYPATIPSELEPYPQRLQIRRQAPSAVWKTRRNVAASLKRNLAIGQQIQCCRGLPHRNVNEAQTHFITVDRKGSLARTRLQCRHRINNCHGRSRNVCRIAVAWPFQWNRHGNVILWCECIEFWAAHKSKTPFVHNRRTPDLLYKKHLRRSIKCNGVRHQQRHAMSMAKAR